MKELISKCGFNCGGCPWGPHARENMADEEFEQFRKRAKQILGYMPMKTPCLTCQILDEDIPKGAKLPPRNCLARKCVTRMNIENCAYCSRFPCDFIKEHSTQWNRKFFEEKHGKPVTDEDYTAFIEPFEGLKRLEATRASLKPEDIVEAAKVAPLKTQNVGFPDLSLPKEEKLAFEKLHRLLANVKRSSLGLTDIDTFAQQQRLKNRIPYLMRFLWILGRFGKLEDDNGSRLVVDAKTYIDNRCSEKTLATWSYVRDVIFKILPKFGVHGKLVPLTKKWKTEMEGLKQKGWNIEISFDESLGGATALEALQTYTRKLEEKYGKRAFRHFQNVDMHVLSKE